MNTTTTQPLTTKEILTEAQASTNMYFFSNLEPLDTSTAPTFTELLEEYTASLNKPVGVGLAPTHFFSNDEPASPFSIYQKNLAHVTPQPVRWLWSKRLPLAGITLLDGDHGCGKSLLALHIAAHVSSGTPMPDGTKTLQGGVVIVSPDTDATTTQLQLLTDLGADLNHVEILSFIQKPTLPSHNSGHHPFSLPEDLLPLLQAIDRIDARLVIFDPFISLLSRKLRCTDRRLCHLLTDLNQRLIERNVACLLIRNCGAKGRHARPSLLERSDHFANIAVSRLLLAPDPIQPDRLLLSHATSRHAALTPTLTLQIQPRPDNPDLPHITILGSHSLQARDLINYRPDTLHRQLLSQHLLQLITATTDPIPVSTLYALSLHSSAFQIQRSLKDLLNMGQIERPTRGFYTLAPTTSASSLNTSATISSIAQPANALNSSAATSQIAQPASSFNTSATISPITQPANTLNTSATITSIPQSASELNTTPATTPIPQPASELNTTPTITSIPQFASELNTTPATTSTSQPASELNTTPATTSTPQPASELNTTPATTLKPKTTKRPHKGRSKHRNIKKRH